MRTAYEYICKSDKSALHSDEHPDLAFPKTKDCKKGYQP